MQIRLVLVLAAYLLASSSLRAQEKAPNTTKEATYKEKSIAAWINDLKAKDPSPTVRQSAIAVLERLGPRDEAAIPFLVEALKFEKVTPAACCMPGMMGSGRRAEPASRIDFGVSQPAAYALGRIGTAAVPALVKALKEHPDPSGTVAALGRVGPSAVPALVELLKGDKDIRVRRGAAQALGQLGEEGAGGVMALIKALDDSDENVQESANEALQLIGTSAKDAVPLLLERLKHKNPAVRSATARALGWIVPQQGASSKWMFDRIGDFSPGAGAVRRTSGADVGPMAKLAVPLLAKLLTDPDPKVRQSAARALSDIGAEAKAAIPALKIAMKDRDLETSLSSMMALSQMGSAGMSILVDLAKKNDKQDRAYYSLSLATAMIAMSAEKDAVPLIVELIKRNESEEPGIYLMALELLGPEAKEAVPILRGLLRTDAGDRKEHVAMVLGRIGPGAKAAVPELKKMLDDPSTRVEAGRALRRIAPDEAKKWLPPLREEIDDLIKELRSPKIVAQLKAASDLGMIGPEAKDAAPTLVDTLKKGGQPGELAGWALTSIGAAAIPALIGVLKDENDGVRLIAIRSLGQMGAEAKEATPELIKALKDGAPGVRLAAAVAIGRFGPGAKAATSALAEAVRDSDADVRDQARKALTKVNPTDSPRKDR